MCSLRPACCLRISFLSYIFWVFPSRWLHSAVARELLSEPEEKQRRSGKFSRILDFSDCFCGKKTKDEAKPGQTRSDHEIIFLPVADRFVKLLRGQQRHKLMFYSFPSPLGAHHGPVLFIHSVFCDKPPNTCGQTPCPHFIRPVCATNGRTRRTFSNQCAVRTFNDCSHDESELRAFRKLPNLDFRSFLEYNIIRKGQCWAARFT